VNGLVKQAEAAAAQKNLKDLYNITKKRSGKFQQTERPVKNTQGHPLTTSDDQRKRRAEHFSELLNRPAPEELADIPPAESILPVNCNKPCKEEIKKAIKTLKSGNVAGPNGIPGKAIKADINTATRILRRSRRRRFQKSGEKAL